jgi:small-conductance mechanosensitive channel
MTETTPAAPPPSGFEMHGSMPDAMAMVDAKLQALIDATRAMFADAAEAPGRLGQAAQLLTDNGDAGPLGSVVAATVLWLAGALLAAFVVRRLLRPTRVRLRHVAAESPGRVAGHIAEAFLVDLAPLAAYIVTGAALGRLVFGKRGLDFPDIWHAVAGAALTNSAIAWLGVIVLGVPLAAKRPGLRLLPLDDAQARRARAFLHRVVVIGTASWLLAESLFLVWLGDGVPRIILIAASLVIGVVCFRALSHMTRRTYFERIWHRLALVSVFGLIATWAEGLLLAVEPPIGRVLGTLAILAAMPLADGMIRLLLHRVKRRLAGIAPPPRRIFAPDAQSDVEALHAVEQPLGTIEQVQAAAETDRALDRLIGVMHDAADLILAVVAAVLLAATWSFQLVGLLETGETRTLLGQAVDAAVTLVVGWYAWRFFETGLAVRLARTDGGAESRARTVQPLLRSVGKLVIGSVALMGALSALGVNIAPLLASAGVVGIAVGFGAQTLVRDLFSGACYLIEDVFRIGDYIEAANAKGTVEKITFRTVALRHQNGPLHYVPYGTLGSVRNNNRDWVIDKFEIPLPIDAPSERIRKMVKKIGEEMLQDPALAKVIMVPLKAKLYRIQPGAKIFRCKVQTPPGLQFEVRTEAYRRIEAALAEAGIPFADIGPRVTVNAAPQAVPPPAEARAAE